MPRFMMLDVGADAPEISVPDPARVISGHPEFRSWERDEADGGLSAGIWEATPGKWRFENTGWEYCRILSGVSVVTEDGHEPRTVRAGDSFLLRQGFRGTWEVIETTRKDYVYRE